MKTLVKTFVCAAALSVSSLSFANDKNTKESNKQPASFAASVYVAKDASIRVAVDKTSPTNVMIVLRNEKNEVVYSENMTKNELKSAYKLNVEALPDGEYTLEITSADKTVTKQIHLSSAKIEVERQVVVD